MTGAIAISKILFGGAAGAAGGSIITMIVSKKLNKKTEDVKTALLEQEFYKNLVSDYQKELKSIKLKLVLLVKQNDTLIKRDAENIKTIKDQNKNLKKWENYCEELKKGIKDRDRTNGLLITELEKHESKIDKKK